MNTKLAQLNDYVKTLSGVRLFYFIAFCFVICLVVGLLIGYLFVMIKNPKQPITVDNVTIPVEKQYYEGRVDFVDPRLYPGKDVSYVLVNAQGNVLFLLKSLDSTLQVAEGHNVKAYGSITKKTGSEKYDTLNVTKVVIKSSEKK
jgi:hypothetical protein